MYKSTSHMVAMNTDGDWVYGRSLCVQNCGEAETIDGQVGRATTYFDRSGYYDDEEVIPGSVGLSLGFYDVEGDMVYEGDEIMIEGLPGGRGIVAYRNGSHGIIYQHPEFGEEFQHLYHVETGELAWDLTKCKITGRRARNVESVLTQTILSQIKACNQKEESEG